MSISREQADSLVAQHLTAMSGTIGIPLEVTLVEEHDVGFLYCYDSSIALKSGNFIDRLAGNAPLLVTWMGDIVTLGTAQRTEFYLEEYRRGRWRSNSV